MSMKALSRFVPLALLVCAVHLAACSGGDEPPSPAPPTQTCAENLNADCTEVFVSPSVYSKIYPDLIQKQCALGSSCHSADAGLGNLVLADPDESYAALLGTNGGTKHVIPYDPLCSPLMVRLDSRDPNYVMPKGSRLPDAALCNFVQWIKPGAQKN